MRPHVARLASSFAVVTMVVLRSGTASAQMNYRELPIGGRTATMGGAGTAAGNDSAMPYLNPAGLAGVPGDIFAISATVYGYTHRSFRDFFFPNGTSPLLGYAVERESFNTTSVAELPSSVMYFKSIGPPDAELQHHVGVSLVIPSARSVDFVGSVAGRLTKVSGEDLETASITSRSTRYYFGPTYALGWGDRLRLGVSLYGLYERGDLAITSTASESVLSGAATTSFTGQSSQIEQTLSLAPVVGVQWRMISNAWVGLGIALPTIPLGGRLQFAANTSGNTIDPTTGSPQATSSTSTADAPFQTHEPLRLNAGLAFENRKALSVALDVLYYSATTDSEVNGVQVYEASRSGDVTRRYARPVTWSTHASSVIDFSVGAEYALSDIFAVRAGAFTDSAARPELGSSSADQNLLRLDRFGGTVGLGLTFGSFDTTIGGVFVRGIGRYGAVDTWITGSVVPVEATETTAMLVLSAAVTTREAQRIMANTLNVSPEALPSLEGGGGIRVRLAPRIPPPLPAERKPPPPTLQTPGSPAPPAAEGRGLP